MLLPILAGGGPSEVDKTYDALRSAEGIGGSATDETGIDGLWRRCRALAISTATSPTRRAFNNGWPFLATDLLPYYERVLGLTNSPDIAEDQRRSDVAALWPAKASAIISDMESELRRIDARFSILLTDEAGTTNCNDGRWFGSNPGADEAPNGAWSSALAGPTTRYLMTAFLDVADQGAMTQNDLRSLSMGTQAMRRMVPSWWNFTMSASDDGFTLDSSPLDITGIGDNE